MPCAEAVQSIGKIKADQFLADVRKLFARITAGGKRPLADDPGCAAEAARKLLVHVAFLYILESKGWLGTPRGGRFREELPQPLLPGWEPASVLCDNEVFSHGGVKASRGKGIRDLFERYEFTLNDDELHAVGPELVGRAYADLLTAEKRRSNGSYYTPREVVRFMCEESVISYLEYRLGWPRQDLALLVKSADARCLRDPRRVDDLLRDVKVFDPAVGAGAFPSGMIPVITNARYSLNAALGGDGRDMASLKRHAIRHSIYGMDIDAGGVELTRLRLWLSLAAAQDGIEGIERPAELAGSIIQGNSLLDPFPIRPPGGFDIVIANPPYNKERDNKKSFAKVLEGGLGKYAEGKMDLWFFFLHLALDVARPGTQIAFITPSYWLRSYGASKLAKRLRSEVRVRLVVDFGDLEVFEGVAGRHMIGFYEASAPCDMIDVFQVHNSLNELDGGDSNSKKLVRCRFDDFFKAGFTDIHPSAGTTVGEHFEVSQGVVQNPDRISKKLARKYGWPAGTGVFVLTPHELADLRLRCEEMEFVRPFLEEREVSRYSITGSAAKYLLYLNRQNCTLIDALPQIKKHLLRFRPYLEQRRETKLGRNQWFHLHWPRQERLFVQPRVVVPSLAKRPLAAFMPEQGFFGLGSSVILARAEGEAGIRRLKYLTSFLNSSACYEWCKANVKLRGAGFDIGVGALRSMPLKAGWEQDVDEVAELFDRHFVADRNGSEAAQRADVFSRTVEQFFVANF